MKKAFQTGALLLLATTATAGEKPAPPARLHVVPASNPPAVVYLSPDYQGITVLKKDAYAGLVQVLLPGDLCEPTDSAVEEAAEKLLSLLNTLPPVYDSIVVKNAGWCPFQMITTRWELLEIVQSQDPAGPSADEDRDGGLQED